MKKKEIKMNIVKDTNSNILFCLEDCKKCNFVKKRIGKTSKIIVITYPHNIKNWSLEQIVEATYHEVFSDLQRTAPILKLSNGEKIKIATKIIKKVEEIENESTGREVRAVRKKL